MIGNCLIKNVTFNAVKTEEEREKIFLENVNTTPQNHIYRLFYLHFLFLISQRYAQRNILIGFY